jgi:DNA-directed RNA polymerase specialized sigma24 family protein
MNSRRRGWSLTHESLERLLLVLDPDRDVAGQKYEAIRTRLIRLFEWRGCRTPESLADETIDRVTRRIDEGVDIRAEDPAVYFCGVARNVLKEYWTSIQRERKFRQSEPSTESLEGEGHLEQDEVDERLDCLDRCLAQLPRESLRLITLYYRPTRGERIASRAELARDLGISLGSLRVRAHRIRRTLEDRVNDCMKERADS